MDESHSDWDPTTPSICLIWHPEFWWVISVHALDKYDMIATSRTTFELLYDIWVWYALKCFIHYWVCFVMFHMPLICSGTFHMPLICSNYSVLHLLWTDMFWNVLSAIDMFQLLYAPFVMDQICFEWHDTYDLVSIEMVSLRILVFCLALWYLTRFKPFLLFWICFVTCWAVFGSLRCYINLSGQLVTLRDVWFGLRQWIAIQNDGQV